MSLSRLQVDHVARLAHLGLRADEIEDLAAELSGVLDHVNRLREVNTDGVEATAHAAGLVSVMREDACVPSWAPTLVLANAPRAAEQQFVVRAVLD